MRGTLNVQQTATGSVGIIPAYAGNTGLLVCPCADGGDHPRVCGEHRACGLWYAAFMGSSPRMRGTLRFSAALDVRAGIIPAYAGNTDTRGA